MLLALAVIAAASLSPAEERAVREVRYKIIAETDRSEADAARLSDMVDQCRQRDAPGHEMDQLSRINAAGYNAQERSKILELCVAYAQGRVDATRELRGDKEK